jgi:hypothetical protein
MRKTLWLAAAVLAALVVEGRGMAQPPDRRGGPPGRGAGPLERTLDDMKLSETKRDAAGAAVRAYQDNIRRMMDLAGADLQLKLKEILSADEYKKLHEATVRFRDAAPGGRPGPGRTPAVDELVERIMSFDKNKDGKVTKDELPERMQYLIEKGDTNKDGALDKEEIKKLAADMARERPGRGFGGPGGRGGPDGRGPGAGPNGFPPRVIERAVEDLKLADKKKESADAAVKANQENVRKLTELARADVMLKMEDILGADDLKKFKTALDREPGPGERDGRPPFPPRRPDRP